MHLLTLATGRTRDAAILALEQKYLTRFTHPWSAAVRELKASTLTEPLAARRQEATFQLTALEKTTTPVIALDERGTQKTSQQWADACRTWQADGIKQLTFLIGGAAGLTPEIKHHAHATWALSTLTFPHQLVRIVLAEQLYRTFTLLTGHPYHRE